MGVFEHPEHQWIDATGRWSTASNYTTETAFWELCQPKTMNNVFAYIITTYKAITMKRDPNIKQDKYYITVYNKGAKGTCLRLYHVTYF